MFYSVFNDTLKEGGYFYAQNEVFGRSEGGENRVVEKVRENVRVIPSTIFKNKNVDIIEGAVCKIMYI